MDGAQRSVNGPLRSDPAAKFGALAREKGTVSIEWRIYDAPGGERLGLRWEERGGLPIEAPLHKGFGSR